LPDVVHFHTKNPNLVHWNVIAGIIYGHVKYLRPFGIFYHLVQIVHSHLLYFPPFGKFYREYLATLQLSGESRVDKISGRKI
jgi:hypothetical protein